MNIVEQIQALDPATLKDVVRQVLRSADVEVTAWHSQPLISGAPATNPTNGGVYRVTGQAYDGGLERAWSLVVKVLKSPAGTVMPGGYVIPSAQADDASIFGYWRREGYAVESALLNTLTGNFVAPRCFGSVERSDGSVWLWLEEITDSVPLQWSAAHYAQVGRHLGQFNGSYLGSSHLTTHAWMSHRWLRSWLETAITGYVPYLENPDVWTHPHMRQAFPKPVQERLLRLWADRNMFLSAIERLPQTFCHLDAYRGNIFIREHADANPQTVAIDWAFAGRAALGEELSALIIGTALVDLVDAATIQQVEQSAFDAYLTGLRASGWTSNPAFVRLAYTASAALRYSFLGAETPFRAILEPSYPAEAERYWGRPWENIVERRAALTYLLLDRADEARAILSDM